MNYFKSLVSEGAMDNTSLSFTVDEIVDAFKAGTILSCNAGTQQASAIRSSELASNITSAPILGFEDGKNPSPAIVAGQSLGIGKYSKNPEEAFDFIKNFYSHENQVKWLMAQVEFYPEDYSELSANLVKAAQEVVFKDADPQEKLDEVANWYNNKNGFN